MLKKVSGCLLLVLLMILVGCSMPDRSGYYDNNYNNNYLELNETGYIDTKTNNKVNVSLDSSNGAYSDLRKQILNNYNIDKNAVNLEQMVNYFNYSYENNSSEQLQSFLEIGDCPWNEQSKLLSIAIKAKDFEIQNKKPNNFVFLLDVSGSMYSDDKLPLMIEAFKILIDNLDDNDRVSIVTYAGADQVLLSGGYGYEKPKISAIISDLAASGSTAGSKGIQTAYQLASEYYIEGGNNRVFLATDGDFNVGISSTEGLKEFISEKRDMGIYLSLFGFGTYYNKATMDTLAQAGNGNNYYIDSILEAQKIFINELGGTLNTVAKDCKAQIELNPSKISKYRVVGYENKQLTNDQFENNETDAGEIGAGHTTICFIEVYLTEDFTETDEAIAKSILRYKDVMENELSKEIVKEIKTLTKEVSNDFIFAASVIEFGLLLRNSEYKYNASYDNIINRINNEQILSDEYRIEFLQLVNLRKENIQ